ncbi:unnamed protein product [Didymodactylos carnosus]|uniref:Peptidase metallopeptidase domain-containing protein n=1 Tax=Didymodactylos carnosus TaxID=1234261 RepID=A0A813VFI8_9BILA|nr:unnamed protein product [Didymodactylos carnosus]CAF3627477.1 unnamed protein product [Didymodactylos carnosus]
MMQFVFVQFLVIILLAKHIYCISKAKSVQTTDDALEYLNKFGYNPCATTTSKALCSLDFKSVVKNYQKRWGLKVTGTLDEQTKKMMNRPRCGLPDLTENKPINELKTRASKWSRNTLTWALRNGPTQLSLTKTTKIIEESFGEWLKYIPLDIQKVCSSCEADFVLEFNRDRHDDPYPFDGSGGTLAHAYLPEDGRVHFDSDETWTESFDSLQTNLFLVAVHELGHALGLDHTFNTKSIMYPAYQPMARDKILPSPDQDAIQDLYGKKTDNTVTAKSPTRVSQATISKYPTLRTTSSQTSIHGEMHTRCRLFLDAGHLSPDKTFHTFKVGMVWRYLIDSESWETIPSTYRSKYKKLPNKVSGSVYKSVARLIYIFSSSHVYRYTVDRNNQIEFKNEQELPDYLHDAVGAIYYLSQVYIVKTHTIHLFDLDNTYEQSEPRLMTEEFPRFYGTVKSAFTYLNMHHFFTADRLVFIWSESLVTWKTYAKPMETSWFACSTPDTPVTRPDRHRHQHHRQHHHKHHHWIN